MAVTGHVIRRAELTMAVDVATRSIPAGIIAPTTKAVDAAAVPHQLTGLPIPHC
jgi:hypothetical protein